MTYASAIQFLYGLQWFGLKLGLENTRRLAALAGNPQERLRFIHVAGTNGKGSTCAMIEAIYSATGLRVGLFTSPHLISFRERIQVNRVSISEADVVRLVQQAQRYLRGFPHDHSPTFFEVVTVMALCYFAEQGCDLVVWETGMGGRLDATNIVTPVASVITNIEFDHERWLGSTLSKIAAEKAGIIKPGVPVVTASDAPEALGVIRAAAGLAQAPLVTVGIEEVRTPPLDTIALPLPGEHQKFNAALALATVRALSSRFPVSDDAVRRGLAAVQWAGRLQKIQTAPDCVTLLDGAHNPAGVHALEAALNLYYPDRRPVMIFGVLQDKDWSAMCHRLSPLAQALYLVPVTSARSARPDDLRLACQVTAAHLPIQICASIEEALELTRDAPFRLITGSLYLVGEALEKLSGESAPAVGERALNEWTPGSIGARKPDG